ncbi:hypothetical protein [Thiomicrorhabdus sp.]|uniref:hypothetical protein n=1 Tax=Thiomicrorhabdus sp. TaxID=2039724 RepID=UPI002AA630B0|nr:hypothetical protein [Thiomicrorhabdus sp.]
MKHFAWKILPAFLTLILVGCGGGGGDSDTTDDSNDLHSAIFSNTTAIADWGTEGVFSSSLTCAMCHTGSSTVMVYNNVDVSPFTKWKHSTMANSLNDPYFNAVVEEEGHVFPDKKVFIEDTCMRCHAPMAYTHAHQTGTSLVADPTTLLADGGYPLATAIADNSAREGVACTACHQIQPDNLGNVASMSGHYKIKDATENAGSDPTIFGPFKGLTAQPMINNTQYTPAYAAHIAESAMCASCHNLYTPTLDLNGDPVLIDPNDSNSIAQFPEQTPYWEWLNSDYSDPTKGNKTCQACHMAEPTNGYRTVISTRPNNLSTQRPDVASGDDANSFFGVHEFVGGNSYLLTLLKTYMNELGLGSASGHTAQGFTDKITATQQFLSQAADIAVTPSLVGSTLNVPVKITNKTGHKLPTSYPSRRMWVHIKVTDTNGSTVFESGAVDSNGRIAKDANFTASKCLEMNKQPDPATFDSLAEGCYEPHHDIINSADQVAIYEGVLGDVNQDITHVLLHARQYIKDNRIPPTGWTLAGQHTNPADTNIKDDGIIGTATTDTNFAPGKDTTGSDASDTVTYEINVSAGTAPFTVTTELYYQTIKPSFVYAMHADDVAHGGIAGDSYVGRFKEMYEQTPPLTETLASQTVGGIQ